MCLLMLYSLGETVGTRRSWKMLSWNVAIRSRECLSLPPLLRAECGDVRRGGGGRAGERRGFHSGNVRRFLFVYQHPAWLRPGLPSDRSSLPRLPQ